MDGQDERPVELPIDQSGTEWPQCPECGHEFKPGHLCRETMIEEISRMRAAFQVSIEALARIRNALIVWRRGQEEEKLREVSGMARTAMKQVEELLEKKKPYEPL